ncbi:VIT1/CCC1 transporter family protein [Salinifilum ghardaiensis]
MPEPSPHAAGPRTLRRWRRRLGYERAEAAVYRQLAARSSGSERDVLLGLAEAEERHAAHWRELLGAKAAPEPRAALRMRVLAQLARVFGFVVVLALAQRAEKRASRGAAEEAAPEIAADERVHEEVVRALAARGRERLSGAFRAAIFGANDGLVSNLALVLGVVGGGLAADTVLLTGLSGLLAGALSMAAGEFVSVRSQRELLAATAPDAQARSAVPHLDVDTNELALVYRARGMDGEAAQRKADAVLTGGSGAASPADIAQDDGHEVVGTGVRAAVTSFGTFACGAFVPVLPFAVGAAGWPAVLSAVVLVGIALLGTGACVGVISGASPVTRALRQLAIGFGAAGITYALGLSFGAVG